MITDFKLFGFTHIISMMIPIFGGLLLIHLGIHTDSDRVRKQIRYFLAALIVLVRGARYVIDVIYDRFEWMDLISLHICHIDLILLVICLLTKKRALFTFCFILGIPMGLAVALFPGTNHPEPGLLRAILFIMSHTLLVVGAVYLAMTEDLVLNFKDYIRMAIGGNLALIGMYFTNLRFNSNYLYLMYAPKGTVIESMEKAFGWPGYVGVMDLLALLLMLMMVFISKGLFNLTKQIPH